jgi:hypothetical protein
MDVFQRGSAVAYVGRIYLTVLRSRSTAQPASLALWQGLTPDEAWFLSAVLAVWFGSSGELQKADAGDEVTGMRATRRRSGIGSSGFSSWGV